MITKTPIGFYFVAAVFLFAGLLCFAEGIGVMLPQWIMFVMTLFLTIQFAVAPAEDRLSIQRRGSISIGCCWPFR